MKHTVVERHVHPKFSRLFIELRSKSRFYQSLTFLDGRLRQKSTKTTQLKTALKLSEEWYRSELGAKNEHPVHSIDATMAERFAAYVVSLPKDRQQDARNRWSPIHGFWGGLYMKDVSPRTYHDFYRWRRRAQTSNHTLHKDITLIRQILKFSAEQGLLPALPFVPRIGKIPHRGRRWLAMPEWKHLLKVSSQRIAEAKNKRVVEQRQDCHDFAVFMVHSMMRVGEVQHLTFGDCRLAKNADNEPILICDVRVSKTGPRSGVACLSGAASVFKRRLKEHTPQERLFPRSSCRAFTSLLKAANLHRDLDGRTRNFRSLRATGISLRVLAGANLMVIANNSGTSVMSINNFYAKHLKSADDMNDLTRVSGRNRHPEQSVERVAGLAAPKKAKRTKNVARMKQSAAALSRLKKALKEEGFDVERHL